MKRRTLRRRSVDSSVERLIVTGLITSREFISNIHAAIQPRLFKMEFASVVARWCKDYYLEHMNAPGDSIQEIYEVEKENLAPANQRIIETFLSDISEEHETRGHFDAEYMVRKTRKYFQNRASEVLGEDILRVAKAGKHDRVKRLIESYNQNSGLTEREPAENTLTDKMVNEYGVDEDESDTLFTYDMGESAIGEMFNKFKRGWLVGILAPMKRGKTWHLDDIGLEALIHEMIVFKFSLEMPMRQQVGRLFQTIGRLTDDGRKAVVPCFDCLYNQLGTCELDERENQVTLTDEEDDAGNLILPEFEPRMRYKPCTACRGDGTDNFYVTSWYKTISTKAKTIARLRKKVKQFKIHAPGRLYTASFRFDATIGAIRRKINDTIDEGGKKPDVVIIDYADIIQVERSEVFGSSERAAFDYVWKSLKRLAMEYDCLVLTATQGNRQSFNVDSLAEGNVSEDIRKLAHCDAMFALNQTREEYERGMMRIAMINHRHSKIQSREVACLQSFDIGAPILDSEWL